MLPAMRALLTLPLLFMLSCASIATPVASATPPAAQSAIPWVEAGPGVSYARFGDGVTASYHVTQIDLEREEIVFFGSSEADRGRTVGEFATTHSALVAINGDYFDEWLSPIGPSRGICGDWTVRAPPVKRRQPVFVAGDGRAAIIDAEDSIPSWADAAVSGWPRVVAGCKAIGSAELPGSDSFTRAPHVRTAVGLSRDRRTVWFVVADVVIDGKIGVTLEQLGAFMRSELGACEALNLDGGGSSAMSVSGRTVSRPKSGVERHVANHIGVALRDGAPACGDSIASGSVDWSAVASRAGLELLDARGSSARLALPFEDGEIMLLSAGRDVIATGTFVTTPQIASDFQKALAGELRVSWTTPIDSGKSRVQLGGRSNLAAIEEGLAQLAARR